MTVPEKQRSLNALRRRFDSGAWDALDVDLLFALSLIAVSSPKFADATDEVFASIGEKRERQAAARLAAERRLGMIGS